MNADRRPEPGYWLEQPDGLNVTFSLIAASGCGMVYCYPETESNDNALLQFGGTPENDY